MSKLKITSSAPGSTKTKKKRKLAPVVVRENEEASACLESKYVRWWLEPKGKITE